jgi:translocation and assembly module TamA
MTPRGLVAHGWWLALFAASCAHQDLGGALWVRQVRLAGNHAFRDRDVIDHLATQPTSWWPFAPKQLFDPAALDIDLERVVAFYAAQGYFDARVTDHAVVPRKDGSVEVVITVEEGQPTHIDEIELGGLSWITPERGGKRLTRLSIHAGDVLNHGTYSQEKRDLERRLKEGGYAYAHVNGQVEVDREERHARIELDADAGPLVRFGQPRFVGQGTIPVHALSTLVTWEPGEVYHPDDLRSTQARLYALGVFSQVALEIPPTPQPVADVTIHVQPGALRELRLGGGVGLELQRYEARLRAEWSFHNWYGGLRTLRLRVRPAYVLVPSLLDVRRQGPAAVFDAELVQPDLFGVDLTGRLVAGYDLGLQEGYQYHGPRASLGVQRSFAHNYLLGSASYNIQFLDFFNYDPAAFDPSINPLGASFKDPYRVAWFEQFVQLDLRDRALDPRSGLYLSTRVEEGFAAIGSAFTYFKVFPELRVYLPLGRRLTLDGRAQLGWLQPQRAEDSPITRRFALGGPFSHRGFGTARLSPQVVDPMTHEVISLGGNGALLFSGDARIVVLRRLAGYPLGLDLFVDAGDVTPRVEQLDISELHVAVGGSLTWDFEVAKIRAGAAYRLNRTEPIGPGGLPNPDPGDRVAIHVSVGEAF